MHFDNFNLHCVISIHALLAESDYLVRGQRPSWGISIHALLAESDPPRVIREPTATGFLSTLSLRRATSFFIAQNQKYKNFYPRSPCGERRVHYDNYNLHCVISIHALLAESDSMGLDGRFKL